MDVELERPRKQREIQKPVAEVETVCHKVEKVEVCKEKKVERVKNQTLKQQRSREITMRGRAILRREKLVKEKCQKVVCVNKKEKVIQRPKMKDAAEFQKIIAQQTKERMQLERHLALATESLQKTAGINVTKYLALEETNQALRQRLLDLDRYLGEKEITKEAIGKKVEECIEAQGKLKEQSELCSDLESQLNKALYKNTELVIENSDLKVKANYFSQLEKECENLKDNLSEAKEDQSATEYSAEILNSKLANLETVVRNLREAAEKRKELERDHAEALAELRARQEEAKMPRKPGEKERYRSDETIETLESKVRELQKKCELQNVCHEELMLEMTSLRRQQAKQSWSNSQQSSLNDGITSPESNISTPDNTHPKSLSNGDSGMVSSLNEEPNCLPFEGVFNTLPSQLPLNTANTTSAAPANYLSSYRNAEQPFLDSNRNFADQTTRNILKYVNYDALPIDENSEFIDIPGKGKVQIYVAKYTYDPLIHSPNENPEAELTVSSGDYIIVYGEMDEDGFFEGELMDGKRGLVPSNFVVKLMGEDLYDFQTQVYYGSNKDSDDSGASFSQELDFIEDYQLPLEDYKRMNDYVDLEDIEEVDEDNLSELDGSDIHSPAPNPPQRLTMEKQLNKSILIAWLAPEGPNDNLEMYHIYVDGVLKNTVKSQERTRALVEGVDSSRPHRISIRSVNNGGKQSKDAACTITIGKDSPLAPAYVTGTNITSTSAIISWLPSNSNFQHVICVNSVEVRIVKPGIFRHTITGLAPNTEYRVSVRSKAGRSTPSKSAFNDEKNRRKMERLTAYVDFKTLPKGLPDPPIDVQVESGPQDSTLLVTWLPVTISAHGGTSNGCPVTGYSVFVDGKRMGEVESPTSDHTLLDISSLDAEQVKFITVRTKSGESHSSDSISCKIPSAVKGKKEKGTSDKVTEDSSDQDELSDIAEEPEEELSDNTQNKTSEKKTSASKANTEKEAKSTHLTKESEAQKKATKDTGTSPHKSSKEAKSQQRHKDSSVHNHDEEYGSVGRTRSRAGPDKLSGDQHHNERDHHPPSHGRHPQNHPVAREKGMAEKRVPVQNPPHAGPKRPNPGYDNGYQRNGDYRNEEDLRAHGNYKKEGEYRREGEYRKETGNRRESRTNHPAPYRDRPRLFVALFDYDPQTMSPNPDGADEELPFSEGQVVKIHGDKDNDGFYRGEANGRIGYVPCNMVSEVNADDEEVAHHLMKDNHQNRPGPPQRRGAGPRHAHQTDHWPASGVRKMVALYDYDPQELSPNVDAEVMELSFSTGDIIYVHGDMDEDGFFMGEIGGVRGLVPSNFMTEVPTEYREGAVPRNELGVGKVSHSHPMRKEGNWEGHQGRGPMPPTTSAPSTNYHHPHQQPGATYAQMPSEHRQHHTNPRSFPNERGPLPNERGPLPNERGPLPNERGPIPNERGPIPNERGPLLHERGPLPNERGPIPNDKQHYPPEKGQYRPERGQHPNDRPGGPYPPDKEHYRGDRQKFPPERGQHPGDRGPYPIERNPYPKDRGTVARPPYHGETRGQFPQEHDQYPTDRPGHYQGDRSAYPGPKAQYAGERGPMQTEIRGQQFTTGVPGEDIPSGFQQRGNYHPQQMGQPNPPAAASEQYNSNVPGQGSQFNNPTSRMLYGQPQKVNSGGKW